MSATPSGLTLPSRIGHVLGLEAIAMLSEIFMGAWSRREFTGKVLARKPTRNPGPAIK
jgi:hypothetical protein